MRHSVAFGLLGILLGWAAVAQEGSESKPKTLLEQMKGRQTSGKYDDIHGKAGNGPNEGEVAPDFELAPLKFYEFGIDETEITAETAGLLYDKVRLSDFAGKKPVALIFGSYT